jgi:hypothetical protein
MEPVDGSSEVDMGESYKPNQQALQSGTDREGNPWVSFDYASLDIHEIIKDPAFRRFLAYLDYTAHRIAADMFLSAMARHEFTQLKAYELHVRGLSDRQIGDELGIDHKTARRWYEDVGATIREVAPLGSQSPGQNSKKIEKRTPRSASL